MNKIIGTAIGATLLTLAAGPASAAVGNYTYDGKDVAWTDGPHTIGIQDKECDHNDAAVRYRLGSQSTVRTLRDTDGCAGKGIARINPSSYPNITSLHVCEYVGATQEIDHCTAWKKILW